METRASRSILASLVVTLACTVVAEQDVVEQAQELAVTEIQVLAPIGYQLNYPEGWLVATDGPVTTISQPVNGGIQIVFDARDFAFMHELGLPREATLDDLVAFNAAFFEISEDVEVVTTDVTVFGAPARRTQLVLGDGRALDALQGFTDEKVFLLYASAATEAMLAAFQATFETIPEGLTPVAE